MLEFICSTCGKRVQGDDSFAGKQVLCPSCNASMTVPQSAQPSDSSTTAIATPDHASLAKITPSVVATDGSFREGEPLPTPPESLPPIHREVSQILMGYVPLLIVLVIVLLLVALLVPAVQKTRQAAARTQSTNNLKNIGLTFHGFHDANKRLPFNGTVHAIPGDNKTGSWAWQILPYLESSPLFTTNPLNTTASVAAYRCPGRGRPTVSITGAWTDYFINSWLNDSAAGAANAPDSRRTMVGITDGPANTILVGHGSIDPTLYSNVAPMAQSTDIFKGGDAATARRLTTNQADTANDTALTWGSPFPQGALMCLGDTTVRLFSYTEYSGGVITNGVSTVTTPGLGAFLTPRGGEQAELPDA